MAVARSTVVHIHSWHSLAPLPFKKSGYITSAFEQAGVSDYRAAAKHTCGLPYGRIRDATDDLAVMREQRGTCSTKHALLRRLAIEQALEVQLMLGIFEMSGDNTPGVGPVLQKYGLQSLPEAHCYLYANGQRVDATRDFEAEPFVAELEFLHEEEITPVQIGPYKISVHQRFLNRWLAQSGAGQGLSPEKIWRIREECILALTAVASAQ